MNRAITVQIVYYSLKLLAIISKKIFDWRAEVRLAEQERKMLLARENRQQSQDNKEAM